MPSPIDSTWPNSANSASLPNWAISCMRIAEISAARISIKPSLTYEQTNLIRSWPDLFGPSTPPGLRRRGSPVQARLRPTIRDVNLPDRNSADAPHGQLQPLQLAPYGPV